MVPLILVRASVFLSTISIFRFSETRPIIPVLKQSKLVLAKQNYSILEL